MCAQGSGLVWSCLVLSSFRFVSFRFVSSLFFSFLSAGAAHRARGGQAKVDVQGDGGVCAHGRSWRRGHANRTKKRKANQSEDEGGRAGRQTWIIVTTIVIYHLSSVICHLSSLCLGAALVRSFIHSFILSKSHGSSSSSSSSSSLLPTLIVLLGFWLFGCRQAIRAFHQQRTNRRERERQID